MHLFGRTVIRHVRKSVRLSDRLGSDPANEDYRLRPGKQSDPVGPVRTWADRREWLEWLGLPE